MSEKEKRQSVISITKPPKLPNGGWGWMCVVGCFIANVLILSLYKAFGVFFVEFIEVFQTSSSSTATISGVMFGLTNLLAPFASALCTKFSCRSVALVGGMIASLGLCLSFFAPNLGYLYFSYGLVTGFGSALGLHPGTIILAFYFDDRLGLANGMCVSGSAVGAFILPPLLEYLIGLYGFRGAILILGGLVLNVCVGGALYRPPVIKSITDNIKTPEHEKLLIEQDKIGNIDKEIEERAEISESDALNIKEALTNGDVDTALPQTPKSINVDISSLYYPHDIPLSRRSSKISVHTLQGIDQMTTSVQQISNEVSYDASGVYISREDPESQKQIDSKKKTGCCGKSSKKESSGKKMTIDFSVMKNTVFLILSCAVVCLFIGYPGVNLILPAYAIERGVSKFKAALLLSILAAADFFGRIGFGWFSDLKIIKRKHGFMFFLSIAGILTYLVSLAESYALLAAYSACFGFVTGACIGVSNVLYVDFLGKEKFAATYGFSRSIRSVFQLAGPAVIGLIKDIYKSFRPCLYFIGTVFIIGVLILFLEPKATQYEANKEAIQKERNRLRTTSISSKKSEVA